MIEKRETIILKDGMDSVLQQINALHGMIGILMSGLLAEDVEKTAADCMECIDTCVKNIRTILTASLNDFDDCIKEESIKEESI